MLERGPSALYRVNEPGKAHPSMTNNSNTNASMTDTPSSSLHSKNASAPRRRLEVASTAATLLLLITGTWGVWAGLPEAIGTPLLAIAYLTGGWVAFLNTAPGLLRGKLDVDFLMLVAAAGAAVVDAWGEGATLLFLFSLSNTLQSFAMERSRAAIADLVQRRPETARLLRGDAETMVPVDSLVAGDRISLRPGEMAPTDGKVTEGESEMDESSITGESRPAPKGPNDAVYAGALNAGGALVVQVVRPASESTLARIIQMVEAAQSNKAKTQRLLDTAEGYYAWIIVLGVVALIIVPWLMGSPLDETFYRAMVVLVVASPCALVISTPAAILSAIARGARGGVLFKGGAYLERMAEIRVVVLDKTGTLTTGEPGLTDAVLAADAPAGFQEEDLLAYAAGMESHSEHVIGRAIRRGAQARGVTPAALEHFAALPGRGVHAEIDGFQVWIGSNRLYAEHGEPMPDDLVAAKERLEREGKSVLVLHRELDRNEDVGVHERGGGWLGLIAVADTMRADAPATVATLRAQGIDRVVMLTGDNEFVAKAIAAEAGIDDYRANLMPEDKVRLVKELQEQYGPVLMIGDGVNDAPALAHAAIGMAMGAAGTDVALESAHCVLMGDELHRIPFALRLAQKAVRTVKQNLAFSFAVIVALVASVFLVDLTMPLGVIGHEGSTLLVCLNGLRLLALREHGRSNGPAQKH